MTWSVTTPPAAEPVTLAEAKLHLRVEADDTASDVQITSLIQAAREHVETVCERALMPQVWTERMSGFPSLPIQLRGGTVTEVSSVTYVDTDGATQTLDPSAYLVDVSSQPSLVVPAYGTNWPAAREQLVSVQVVYQLGYADAASVPAAIKSVILLLVGDLFANREAAGPQAVLDNPALDRLLVPYKRIVP